MLIDIHNIKGDILVVDDTPANLRLLRLMLMQDGHKVRPVLSGEDAIRVVQAVPQVPIDLVLLDINMPGMNGFEVCQSLKNNEYTRDIPVIFISAREDHLDKVQAFTTGGVDYITKPFQVDEVLARVRTHLALSRTQKELYLANSRLNQDKSSLEERIKEEAKALTRSQIATIFALAKLAESRDPDTGAHLESIQKYCEILAEEMRYYPAYEKIITDQFIMDLKEASALHDIGKVGIKDAILLKTEHLDEQEFEEMKRHTRIGADTLREVDKKHPNGLIKMGIEIAESHHERWNGTGYPYGKAGYDIPLSARIVALADVFDALINKRPYKAPFTFEQSRAIILADRGRHFDPDVVDCFQRAERKFRLAKDV